MKTIVTAALVASAASCAMGGTLVYGQRRGGIAGGYFFSGLSGNNRIADDFVLASATSLTSAEFWGYHSFGGSLAGMTFDVSVWADQGPGLGVSNGGLIHLETFAFASLAPTTVGGLTKMTATLAAPIALNAATKYWFSIGSDAGEDYTWAMQGPGSPDPYGTRPIDYDVGGNGTWEGPFNAQNDPEGLAFALYGDSGPIIPLPSAGAIAVLGLAWVGATRRRPLGT